MKQLRSPLRSQERRWHLRPRLWAKVRPWVGASLQRHRQGASKICWESMVMERVHECKYRMKLYELPGPWVSLNVHDQSKLLCWEFSSQYFHVFSIWEVNSKKTLWSPLAAGGQFYSKHHDGGPIERSTKNCASWRGGAGCAVWGWGFEDVWKTTPWMISANYWRIFDVKPCPSNLMKIVNYRLIIYSDRIWSTKDWFVPHCSPRNIAEYSSIEPLAELWLLAVPLPSNSYVSWHPGGNCWRDQPCFLVNIQDMGSLEVMFTSWFAAKTASCQS